LRGSQAFHRLDVRTRVEPPPDPKQFGATNAVVTLAAMSSLVWVVYFHEGNTRELSSTSCSTWSAG